DVFEALANDPQDSGFLLLRANLLQAQGNWPQAIKPLNLLLNDFPNTRGAYLLKGKILYYNMKNREGALNLLRDAAKRFPEDAETLELIGMILLENANLVEGLKMLEDALVLDPERVSLLRTLLGTSVSLKRWIQAGIYLSRIIDLSEGAAETTVAEAAAAETSGQETISIGTATIGKMTTPLRGEDLVQAYQIYSNLEDSNQALYYAEKLYQETEFDVSWPIYATALLVVGRRQDAQIVIDDGLQQTLDKPVRSELLLLKARDIEDNLQRLRYLQESLLANPDSRETLVLISRLYLQQEQPRKAVIYLKHALTLEPDNESLQTRLEKAESLLESITETGNTP
ncbi:MAG TPA: tetratricopeptide repeat protein, partial [bacterium]|nr:tetratricopeptide repeat protein [bacterium]